MTRSRVVALFVLAWLTVSFAVVVTPASAAAGASITKVGWWSRNPASSAPEDAFNVANAPDGPVSVGAVEVTGSGTFSSAALILEEAGGIQNDSAKLQVCVTPNAWDAGGPQSFGDAPKAECDRGKVELTRNGASSTWAADVRSLLADIERTGRVSLMVVPGGAATVPVGFEVRFAKVTLSATAASTGSEATATTSGSSSETPATTGGFSGSSGNNVSDSPDFSSGASFDAPATIAPAVPTTADGIAGVPSAPDAAAPTADAAAGPSSPGELAAVPTEATAGVTTGGGNATLQAIFFVFVALVAGLGAGGGRWFYRERYSSR